MNKGTVIVLTGASSVNKSEIRDRLMKDKDLNLFYSISLTTRPKKEKEVDGKDYYFIDFKSFAQSIKNKELLEYTEFNGYYYGTPKQNIQFLIDKGKNILIETEAQGVGQIKLAMPEALAFFIMPTNMEDLEKSIRERYKDDEASINKRISKARVEMELAPLFRNSFVNNDSNKTFNDIKKIILESLAKGENNGN